MGTITTGSDWSIDLLALGLGIMFVMIGMGIMTFLGNIHIISDKSREKRDAWGDNHILSNQGS